MKLNFTISGKQVFTALICVLWSYKALIRYFQSLIMHIPVLGELAYVAFPFILFSILILGSFGYIAKRLKGLDLLFYTVILIVSLVTIMIGSRTNEKFNDYALGFLTYVVPMYFIGIAAGKLLHNDDKILSLLEKISIVSVLLNVFYYASIGLSFQAEWMSSQYIPYMLLPHISLITLSIFREFKLYKIATLLLGLVFMIFLGNRGSIVCYLVLLLVVIMHKANNASYKAKLGIAACLGGLIIVILFTDVYDAFTLFLLSKAQELGMSTRVVLFLRRDFEVVSFDSNRLGLQEQLFDAINERPFGYGLAGDFSIIGGYSHNILIEWLVEFGYVFGGGLIVAFLALLFSSIRAAKNWEERSVIWLFISNVFIMLLISETYLGIPEFFFLIGLCVSIKRENRNMYEGGQHDGIIYNGNLL